MLTEERFPWTGIYYGPSSTKQTSKGPTAEALKRAMIRLGYMTGKIDDTDDIYNANLEAAMSDWQQNVGILPPAGQYGKPSWLKMRAQKIPNAPHKGEWAMDEYALALVRNEHVAKQKPTLCYPFVQGVRSSVCQGLHPTAGFPGNWAIDFCASPGTTVVAVEAGLVTKLSGHPPSDDTSDAMGIFGWSTHVITPNGYHYFYTHFGRRAPGIRVGLQVDVGRSLGMVGDQHYRPDHAHVGCSSPLGQADARAHILRVSRAKRIPAL